jgi:hypothetical protein
MPAPATHALTFCGQPAVSDLDATFDRIWFDRHPGRFHYARPVRDGWVLVVRRLTRDDEVILLRTWAHDVAVPNDEYAAKKLWVRSAWPERIPKKVR